MCENSKLARCHCNDMKIGESNLMLSGFLVNAKSISDGSCPSVNLVGLVIICVE